MFWAKLNIQATFFVESGFFWNMMSCCPVRNIATIASVQSQLGVPVMLVSVHYGVKVSFQYFGVMWFQLPNIYHSDKLGMVATCQVPFRKKTFELNFMAMNSILWLYKFCEYMHILKKVWYCHVIGCCCQRDMW